ncbi:hypothetical protein AB9P05_03810 [Roseivirga sp. BDSF3-8]|uniref:hypothetical protein n=1 Tax=Roseivirga sp. BDSF3-8 TaxID=3241598 RepID=UPI003531E726
MKKLSLKNLTVNSFTTTEKRVIKGGAEMGPTEHKVACPPTKALRDPDCDVTGFQ